jgi:asparagine synthase (glutamine-hydrolysing)
MSIQFGRWNFEETAPAVAYIEQVNAVIAPYGPDSNESYSRDGVKILYRSFCTTKESHRETQPHVLASGPVLTWDGRLDNRAELIGELHHTVTPKSTDVEIVAASFERWDDKCLGKLIGDWALSIWNPRERYVLLAKDPIGTKHLFYSFDDKQLTWCTILDPLVLFADKTFRLCEEYVAAWLTNQFPAAHLTPYVGIQAVPPSCSVLLRPGNRGAKHTITKYWDFDPNKLIRYRTHAEYKEHFRSIFATAVQRRLRSDRPVLAELSGGMDSSSVVCMADVIMGVGTQGDNSQSPLASRSVECPRLDTISWFGDFYAHLEPDTNEFTWISKVEQKRGRAGFHINLNELKTKQTRSLQPFMSSFDNGGFACTPAPRSLSRLFQLYAAHFASQGYRTTLSGVGGDHVTGREPTPLPELRTLLARGRFITLARQVNAWAVKMQQPSAALIWEVIRGFLPRTALARDIPLASWLESEFVRRNYAAFCDHPPRVKVFSHLPSVQHSLHGLDGERRLIAHWDLNPTLYRDVRYPYLDREFLEFMYAIPREQVVRAGEHRWLMRNALVGIVPDDILNRKRKAFLPPDAEKKQENNRSADLLRSVNIGPHMIASSLGLIDASRFSTVLQDFGSTETSIMRMLTRTLRLESWLRHLASNEILAIPQTTQRHDHPIEIEKVPLSLRNGPVREKLEPKHFFIERR